MGASYTQPSQHTTTSKARAMQSAFFFFFFFFFLSTPSEQCLMDCVCHISPRSVTSCLGTRRSSIHKDGDSSDSVKIIDEGSKYRRGLENTRSLINHAGNKL